MTWKKFKPFKSFKTFKWLQSTGPVTAGSEHNSNPFSQSC